MDEHGRVSGVRLWLVCPGIVPFCLAALIGAQAPTENGRLGLSLLQITEPWTGDLDGMIERRMVYPSVALRKGGEIAWAVRKDNPKLKAALDDFLATPASTL